MNISIQLQNCSKLLTIASIVPLVEKKQLKFINKLFIIHMSDSNRNKIPQKYRRNKKKCMETLPYRAINIPIFLMDIVPHC